MTDPMAALTPLIDYAWTQGHNFWLIVGAAILAVEAISGRGWWLWGALGAWAAALLTMWLQLNPFVETAAFVAATMLGLVYSLQLRIGAAKRRSQSAVQPEAEAA